jgi:hypothetical protein
MTQENIDVLCKTWLQTVLIISTTVSIVTLLKEKAIANDNILRFAAIIFATYAFLCVLINDHKFPIIYQILSGLIGAIGTFLFTRK